MLSKIEEKGLLTQLFTRNDESLVAIENGNTVTLKKFEKGNKNWLRLNHTK